MRIRMAVKDDLQAIAEVEAQCFPAAEAAGEEEFKERLRVYPNHFWLLEEDGKLIGFINGMVTDERTIRDAMFEQADLHKEDGRWQAVFGVNTIPSYRHRGMASRIMRQVIADAQEQGRAGCILTCKEELIPFYESFGYKNMGKSQSVHGGAVWYDMVLEF